MPKEPWVLSPVFLGSMALLITIIINVVFMVMKMLDVRKPMGLFICHPWCLAVFSTACFFSKPVPFFTPDATFSVEVKSACGARSCSCFGALMLALARFVQVSTVDRELAQRESELNRADRKTPESINQKSAC